MSSIHGNLRTGNQYRAATGLNRQQFEAVLDEFEKLYNPKEGNPFITHNRPVPADKGEALFFVLHYLKSYPTLENLGLYFGFSKAAASHYLDILTPILRTALGSYAPLRRQVFKDQSEFDHAFAGVEEIIIDVTEVPVERPSDDGEQKTEYSGKKKRIPGNG